MKTAGECRRFFVFRATLACSRCRLRLRLRLQSLQLGDCDSIFGECRIALVLDPLEVRESLLLAALEGVAQAEVAAGFGSLVVVVRQFQESGFIDLASEKPDRGMGQASSSLPAESFRNRFACSSFPSWLAAMNPRITA